MFHPSAQEMQLVCTRVCFRLDLERLHSTDWSSRLRGNGLQQFLKAALSQPMAACLAAQFALPFLCFFCGVTIAPRVHVHAPQLYLSTRSSMPFKIVFGLPRHCGTLSRLRANYQMPRLPEPFRSLLMSFGSIRRILVYLSPCSRTHLLAAASVSEHWRVSL